MKRNVFIGAGFLALLAALGVGQSVFEKQASAQAGASCSGAPVVDSISSDASACITVPQSIAPPAPSAG